MEQIQIAPTGQATLITVEEAVPEFVRLDDDHELWMLNGWG